MLSKKRCSGWCYSWCCWCYTSSGGGCGCSGGERRKEKWLYSGRGTAHESRVEEGGMR